MPDSIRDFSCPRQWLRFCQNCCNCKHIISKPKYLLDHHTCLTALRYDWNQDVVKRRKPKDYLETARCKMWVIDQIDGWGLMAGQEPSCWGDTQNYQKDRNVKLSHIISWDLFHFVLLLVIFHCMFSVLYSSLTSITVWSTVKALLIVYKSKAWKFLQLGKVMEFNYNIPDQEKL